MLGKYSCILHYIKEKVVFYKSREKVRDKWRDNERDMRSEKKKIPPSHVD